MRRSSSRGGGSRFSYGRPYAKRRRKRSPSPSSDEDPDERIAMETAMVESMAWSRSASGPIQAGPSSQPGPSWASDAAGSSCQAGPSKQPTVQTNQDDYDSSLQTAIAASLERPPTTNPPLNLKSPLDASQEAARETREKYLKRIHDALVAMQESESGESSNQSGGQAARRAGPSTAIYGPDRIRHPNDPDIITRTGLYYNSNPQLGLSEPWDIPMELLAVDTKRNYKEADSEEEQKSVFNSDDELELFKSRFNKLADTYLWKPHPAMELKKRDPWVVEVHDIKGERMNGHDLEYLLKGDDMDHYQWIPCTKFYAPEKIAEYRAKHAEYIRAHPELARQKPMSEMEMFVRNKRVVRNLRPKQILFKFSDKDRDNAEFFMVVDEQDRKVVVAAKFIQDHFGELYRRYLTDFYGFQVP